MKRLIALAILVTTLLMGRTVFADNIVIGNGNYGGYAVNYWSDGYGRYAYPSYVYAAPVSYWVVPTYYIPTATTCCVKPAPVCETKPVCAPVAVVQTNTACATPATIDPKAFYWGSCGKVFTHKGSVWELSDGDTVPKEKHRLYLASSGFDHLGDDYLVVRLSDGTSPCFKRRK